MNDLQPLRDLAGNVPAASPDVLRTARLELVAAAQREAAAGATVSDLSGHPVRKRRSLLPRFSPVRGLAAVAAAGLLAIGVQAVFVTTPGGGGLAAASAAELLERAGSRVGSNVIMAGPGQYTKVTRVTAQHGVAEDENGPVLGADGKPLRYLQQDTDQLWLPVDADTAVVRRTSPAELTAGNPGDEQILRSMPWYGDTQGSGVTTSPHPDSSAAKAGDPFAEFSKARMKALPRDPRQLLTYVERQTRMNPNPQAYASFDYLSNLLRWNLAPADAQAALFQAAALIPGVDVVDRDVTIGGPTGVAVAMELNGVRDELVFDPETGLVIGERETSTSPDPGNLIGDNVQSWTTVRTEIVDSAPAQPSR